MAPRFSRDAPIFYGKPGALKATPRCSPRLLYFYFIFGSVLGVYSALSRSEIGDLASPDWFFFSFSWRISLERSAPGRWNPKSLELPLRGRAAPWGCIFSFLRGEKKWIKHLKKPKKKRDKNEQKPRRKSAGVALPNFGDFWGAAGISFGGVCAD